VIYEKRFSLVLLIFSALVAAYLVFLGVISISAGLQHSEQGGLMDAVCSQGVRVFWRFSGFSFEWPRSWFRP